MTLWLLYVEVDLIITIGLETIKTFHPIVPCEENQAWCFTCTNICWWYNSMLLMSPCARIFMIWYKMNFKCLWWGSFDTFLGYKFINQIKTFSKRTTYGIWNSKRNLKLDINKDEEDQQILLNDKMVSKVDVANSRKNIGLMFCLNVFLYAYFFTLLLENSFIRYEILLDFMCYLSVSSSSFYYYYYSTSSSSSSFLLFLVFSLMAKGEMYTLKG